ncbi:NAD(P)/FAD-dependent oxidoreductase [Amycolatopsis sp. EV170708-02-1]|uniref:NAD(P)/FAD-dependent oxidoreductase n=1 Tax=Amycolatopsis sp. EV170708-02-1 TaxID=2919322 RepID=UPI001F0C70FA|nr:FAD-dependent oxidoreductase [Amycolatopsis sp. EV170708-02-1]UMP07050.1 FAD-dependent oxidoreductase [Amycolatopsis sp. EV170708-02-1]
MSRQRHVIVGGGVAAASAAATLRANGFEGEVCIVSDDVALPYERPPLSKRFLSPETDGTATLVKSADWYAEHDVTVLLRTRAESLDTTAKTIDLSTAEQLSYDKLLIATGVRARTLPHVDSDRIQTLRSIADAQEARTRIAAADRVAILGGGFIGCEAASTAVSMGKRVTVLERTETLMQAALGPVIGGVMTDVHRAAGVHVVAGVVVQRIDETPTTVVARTDHGRIEADLVLVGAGSQPNVELAHSAGIEVKGGIVTDQFSRTSARDVFAAGDVASTFHPFYKEHLRVEHHDSAIRHGASAAKNMLGLDAPFAEAHWFWSDQYDHSIQQVGRAKPDDDMVLRGSLDDLSFSAFSLRDGRITRVISLNRPKDVLAVRRMLFTDHTVSAEQLQDEATPLNRLARR